MQRTDKIYIIYAVKLLSGFVVDLTTAADTWRRTSEIAQGKPSLGAIAYTRMSLSHLILNLAKLIEFYDRFSHVLPAETREYWRGIRNDVRRRGVPAFRNSVIGHIWDRKKNRPLLDSEIDANISQIAMDNPIAFVEWINGHDVVTRAASVVGHIEKTRNLLRDAHEITNEEARM